MGVAFDHDFYLNSDGSGKVLLHWTGPVQPDMTPQQFLTDEVTKAKGVDTWGGLSFDVNGGEFVFDAIAYFPDISRLRFHCGGFHSTELDFKTCVESGNTVIENVIEEVKPDPNAVIPTEEEARAQLATHRSQMQAMRGFLEGMFAAIKGTITVRVPNRILSVQNAQQLDSNSVQTRMDGQILLKVFDRLATDDELMIKLLRSPQQGPQALFALLGGEKGPVKIIAEGQSALFDYNSEMMQATEQFKEFAATLPQGPRLSEPLANVRVIAARFIREADDERSITPMGCNFRHVELTLCGDVSGRVASVEECGLKALRTSDGRDLLPEDDWGRRISFPKCSKDGKSIYFDIEAKISPDDLTGFAEIAGVATCVAAGEPEDVDVKFPAFEAGAVGQALGAELREFNDDGERIMLGIKLDVGIDALAGARLTGDSGDVELFRRGYSSSGDSCNIEFEVNGRLPENPRLLFSVCRTLDQMLVPFSIKNIGLDGKPL